MDAQKFTFPADVDKLQLSLISGIFCLIIRLYPGDHLIHNCEFMARCRFM